MLNAGLIQRASGRVFLEGSRRRLECERKGNRAGTPVSLSVVAGGFDLDDHPSEVCGVIVVGPTSELRLGEIGRTDGKTVGEIRAIGSWQRTNAATVVGRHRRI